MTAGRISSVELRGIVEDGERVQLVVLHTDTGEHGTGELAGAPGCTAGAGIPGREPADPVRRGHLVTAVSSQQVITAPATWAASPGAGLAKTTGAQLLAAFPPRPVASSWPATQAAYPPR